LAQRNEGISGHWGACLDNQVVLEQMNGWNEILQQDNSPDDFGLSSTDIMTLDNEWRQIYWQEPGLGLVSRWVLGWL
jgi:hypothetical protein